MADPKTFFEDTLASQINGDPDKFKAINAIFLFTVNGQGTWTVNLQDAPGVQEGDAGNSACQISMELSTWDAIQADISQAMGLFFSGDIKVEGDMMLATKLQEILGGA